MRAALHVEAHMRNSEPDYSFSLAGKALLISMRNITGESIDSVGQDFVSKGGSKKQEQSPGITTPASVKVDNY